MPEKNAIEKLLKGFVLLSCLSDFPESSREGDVLSAGIEVIEHCAEIDLKSTF